MNMTGIPSPKIEFTAPDLPSKSNETVKFNIGISEVIEMAGTTVVRSLSISDFTFHSSSVVQADNTEVIIIHHCQNDKFLTHNSCRQL